MQVEEFAPIGDGTKIGKKWQNWQWEPTRLYSNWEDNEESPVEPRYSSEIKQMLDDGFQFTNDYNLLKREISRDSTMLKDHGYYISAEESVMISDLNEPVVLRSAYNADGHYIGSPEDAKFLCEECGIYPQPAKPNANICTIGKGKDGKWYGWSHRALHGFGEGDTVKQGDIAYLPDTKEAAIEKVQNFWDKSKVLIVDDTDNGFKFKISSGLIENVTFRRIRIGMVGDTPWMYPAARWSAMMIDFNDDRPAGAPPGLWARGVVFEDISVVSEKVPSQIVR